MRINRCLLVSCARDEYRGAVGIGLRGTHCSQEGGIAFLQKLRLLSQSTIFSAFRVVCKPYIRILHCKWRRQARLAEKGHTLLDDVGIGGLLGIAVNETNAECLLPRGLAHGVLKMSVVVCTSVHDSKTGNGRCGWETIGLWSELESQILGSLRNL